MKILFFASDYRIGLSTLLTDELLAFYRNDKSIFAVSSENEQEGGLFDRIKDVPYSIIKGLDDHSDFLRKVSELKKIVEDNFIDIVHVQNNWQLCLITYLKIVYKKPIKVLYTLHGFRHNNLWKSIVAKIIIGTALLLFVDKVICMCNNLKKQFRFLSFKIAVIPLGISDSFFSDYIPISTEGLFLIFPAQFRYGKNQEMLIEAFAEYINKSGDQVSTLTLPGTGQYYNKAIELSKQLNISDRVHFPGYCTKEEIRQLYLKSNVGVVCSNSETFGQSIVEPYVLGRCVISKPVGVATDIIKNGISGFLFQNKSELVKILVYLNNNIDKLNDISVYNWNNKNSFQWDTISEKYYSMLKTL